MTVNTLTRLNIAPAASYTPTNPAVWYPCHEGTGTTLTDVLGNGPSLTVAGTTGSIWGTVGEITPNATDVRAGGQNAYVDSLCSLSDIRTNGKMLIVGFEIVIPSASSAFTAVVGWGRMSATIGGWYFGINGSDQPAFAFRGDNDAAESSITFGKNIADTFSTAKRLMFALRFADANTIEITYFNEDLTTGLQTMDVTGKTLPVAATTDGLTLFARRTAAATYDRFAGTGSSRINNIFIYKHPTVDLGFAQSAYTKFQQSRREFPKTLRGI